MRIINLSPEGEPKGTYTQLKGTEDAQGFQIAYYIDYTATTSPSFVIEEEILLDGASINDIVGHKAIMIHNIDSTYTLRIYEVYWEVVEISVGGILKKQKQKRIRTEMEQSDYD